MNVANVVKIEKSTESTVPIDVDVDVNVYVYDKSKSIDDTLRKL